jgi:hypothetical protein
VICLVIVRRLEEIPVVTHAERQLANLECWEALDDVAGGEYAALYCQEVNGAQCL